MSDQLKADIEALESVATDLERGHFGGGLAEPLRDIAKRLREQTPAPAPAAAETPAAEASPAAPEPYHVIRGRWLEEYFRA